MKPHNFAVKLTVAGLACCATMLMPAYAQDAKVTKEREALRRAQTALRAAADQQQALQADKAQLTQEKQKLEKALAGALGQGQNTDAKLRAALQRTQTLEGELQASRQAAQAQEAASQQQEQVVQQQLLVLRRESAEHLQAARALSTLLERSTEALADAEAKNHKLYAVGQELVQRYLSRSTFERADIGDPLLGLTDVKLEDQAEAMRSKLAEQRIR